MIHVDELVRRQPSVQKLKEFVRKLAQAPHIPESVVEAWYAATLDTIVSNAEELIAGSIAWHARRLSGIGSSEMGALVASLRGMNTYFLSPRELYFQKLMIVPPEASTPDTRRGTLMEPIIRDHFLQVTGSKRREDLVEKISAHRHSKFPWQIGNPDDVVEMPGGAICLVDYKAPRPDVLAKLISKGDTKFEHKVQLNSLDMLAQDLGINFDKLLLCSFDYMSFSVDIAVIDRDQELRNDIITAGEAFHQNLLNGDAPAFEVSRIKSRDSIPPALLSQIDESAALITLMNEVANHASERVDRLKGEIREAITENFVVGDAGKLLLPGQTVFATTEINVDRLETFVQVHGAEGFDLANRETWAPTLNQIANKDPEVIRCLTEKYRIATSQVKSGPVYEYVQSCKSQAKDFVESVASMVPNMPEMSPPPPPAKRKRKAS